MSELNLTNTESTFSEAESISSTVRKGVRFYHPESLSKRKMNKLHSGYINSATAVNCTHNQGQVASEVKHQINAGLIFVPPFDIWLKTMYYLQWEPAEKRLCFSKEKFRLDKIEYEPERESEMQEDFESSNEPLPSENLQGEGTCTNVKTNRKKANDAKAVKKKRKQKETRKNNNFKNG